LGVKNRRAKKGNEKSPTGRAGQRYERGIAGFEGARRVASPWTGRGRRGLTAGRRPRNGAKEEESGKVRYEKQETRRGGKSM